jgi:hypothetical protein
VEGAGDPPLLELAGLDPCAVGQLRRIYRHPRHPGLLVKLVREDAIERRWGRAAAWYKRLPRARQYGGYVRELKEYVALRARHPREALPVARMLGVVETDLGLGLVSEAVRTPDGSLAPTLSALYQRDGGFSPAIERELARFLDALLACGVVVGDLHAWNIVFGSDSRGGPRFVLVDGFGEKHAVPLTSMSRRFNARNTRRLFRRMRRQLQELVPLGGPAPPG